MVDERKSVFQIATEIVQILPKEGPIQISLSKKLELYGLFKVGTIGPNTTEKPPIWELENRLKWSAWSEVTLSPEESRKKYVEILMEILLEYNLNPRIYLKFMENLPPDYLDTLVKYALQQDPKKFTNFSQYFNPNI